MAGVTTDVDGSAEDQSFEPGELLFRRYPHEHFVDNRRLPCAFRFPRPSFNRAKYSKPEDVLHPDCCDGKVHLRHGILVWSISELPNKCCYAHCEVRCTLEGNEVEQPSKAVREKFCVALSLKMAVHTHATP